MTSVGPSRRPALKHILLSFLSIQVIVIAVLIFIPVILHVGTYGVHRILVTHARHLGTIQAPPRKVLLWSKEFHNYDVYKDSHEDFHEYEDCEIPCMATMNRAHLDTCNAVVIHVSNMEDMPVQWIAQQYRVLFNDEVKHMDSIEALKNNGQFHISLNSLPRQLVKQREPDELPQQMDYSLNRSKTAIMLVQNEAEYAYYAKYLSFFEKHFHVDAYQTDDTELYCTPVEDTQHPETTQPSDCEKVIKGYKFAILPESAFEEHYVTERLRLVYEHKVLPVLFDVKKEYLGILPRASYLTVHNFNTPADLVQFLVMLDHNSNAYNRYFDWTKDHQLYEVDIHEQICKLCSYIRELDKVRHFKAAESHM